MSEGRLYVAGSNFFDARAYRGFAAVPS
jgi:hypothetical protein